MIQGVKELWIVELRGLYLEPDRKRAIRMALEMARDNDTVLCLGKGHEGSIIYEDGPIPWNEVEITREILQDVIRLYQ